MWTAALGLLQNKNILIAAGVIVLFLGGFTAGWKGATWKNDSEKVAAIERTISEYEERDKIREEIDTDTLKSLRDQIKGYTDGKEKVRKYVKDNPSISSRNCLDATGVQLFNMGPSGKEASD